MVWISREKQLVEGGMGHEGGNRGGPRQQNGGAPSEESQEDNQELSRSFLKGTTALQTCLYVGSCFLPYLKPHMLEEETFVDRTNMIVSVS